MAKYKRQHSYLGDSMIETITVGCYCRVTKGVKDLKQIKENGICYKIECPEPVKELCLKCKYKKNGFIFR